MWADRRPGIRSGRRPRRRRAGKAIEGIVNRWRTFSVLPLIGSPNYWMSSCWTPSRKRWNDCWKSKPHHRSIEQHGGVDLTGRSKLFTTSRMRRTPVCVTDWFQRSEQNQQARRRLRSSSHIRRTLSRVPPCWLLRALNSCARVLFNSSRSSSVRLECATCCQTGPTLQRGSFLSPSLYRRLRC